MWKSILFLVPLVTGFAFATSAGAEQVCVEDAAGVCLKYKTVPPKKAAPAQPVRPAAPTFAATPEAKAEKDLNLSRNEYRLVQSGLKTSGHYSGPLDGLMGGGSREALAAWQAANGAPANGYLTLRQALVLQSENPPMATPALAAPAPQPAAPAGPEHPVMGRTYEQRHSVYPGSTVFGDAFIRLTRTSDSDAILEVEYVDASMSAFSFRDQCIITIKESVSCAVRARGGYWQVTGDLPALSLNGGSFSKSYEMW